MAHTQIRRVILTRRSANPSANRVRIASRAQGACRFCRAYEGGCSCHDPTLFVLHVRAAGLMEPFVHLLRDYQLRGIHMSQIIRAEHIFQNHRALLVEFNKYLPPGYSCFVPPEEEAN